MNDHGRIALSGLAVGVNAAALLGISDLAKADPEYDYCAHEFSCSLGYQFYEYDVHENHPAYPNYSGTPNIEGGGFYLVGDCNVGDNFATQEVENECACEGGYEAWAHYWYWEYQGYDEIVGTYYPYLSGWSEGYYWEGGYHWSRSSLGQGAWPRQFHQAHHGECWFPPE